MKRNKSSWRSGLIPLIFILMTGFVTITGAQNKYEDYSESNKTFLIKEDFKSKTKNYWPHPENNPAFGDPILDDSYVRAFITRLTDEEGSYGNLHFGGHVIVNDIIVEQNKDFEIETTLELNFFGDINDMNKDEIDANEMFIYWGGSKDSKYFMYGLKHSSVFCSDTSDPGFQSNYSLPLSEQSAKKLTIRKVKDRYYLFLNEEFIDDMPFVPFYGNEIGFFSETMANSLHSFKISYLSESIPPPPPPEIEVIENEPMAQRSSKSESTNSSDDIESGEFHAVIIGVQDYYDNRIDDLSNPIKDAQAVYNVLIENYTFHKNNVKLLKNPEREEILNYFDVLSSRLNSSDNLLIFFAGHGSYDKKINQGYWWPADAKRNKRGTWISNGDLRDYIASMETNNTLLIADACFAGGILKTRNPMSDASIAIKVKYQIPSRKALTSGALNEVPDKSVFLEYLVKRLKENQKKYLSATSLFSSFEEAVINNSPNEQIPQLGTIRMTGDEGGDFVFIKKEN